MPSIRRIADPPQPSTWRIEIKGRLYDIEAVWCVMSVDAVVTFRDENDNVVRAIKDWSSLWKIDNQLGRMVEVTD